jgi:hypothetical protein
MPPTNMDQDKDKRHATSEQGMVIKSEVRSSFKDLK